MVLKQFEVGQDCKRWLLCLKQILAEELKEKYGSEGLTRVEYGFILNQAVLDAGDLTKIDFKELLDKKLVIPSSFEIDEKKVSGGTIKFKLKDGVEEKIDQATLLISEALGNVRTYRSFGVKMIIKNYLLKKLGQ